MVKDIPLPRRDTSIQALRGFACLLVVFQHAGYYALQSLGRGWREVSAIDFGHVGVVLFFMISGTVMMRCLKEGKSFLWHRAARIYPPFWVAMAGGFILSVIGGSQHWHFTWGAFFLLPEKQLNQSLYIPYWTLIYEIVFYALLYCFILSKMQTKRLIPLGLCWALLIVARDGVGPPVNIMAPWTSIILSPLNLFFITGMMLGRGVFDRFAAANKYALIALCPFFWALSHHLATTSLAAVYALEIAALLCLFLAARQMTFPQTLIRLGDFSYGLYLVHSMIIAAAMHGLAKLWPEASFTTRWIVFFIPALIGGTIYGALDYFFHRRFVKKST